MNLPWEYIGCFIMLGVAFVTDIKTMKIPNWITVGGLVTGVLAHLIVDGWSGGWFALQGAGAGFGILLLMYWCRAVGGGDVKLFAGIGAWTGTLLTLQILFYSVMAAGLIGLVVLLFRKEMFVRIKALFSRIFSALMLRSIDPLRVAAAGQIQIPFMLAVLPGAILTAALYS